MNTLERLDLITTKGESNAYIDLVWHLLGSEFQSAMVDIPPEHQMKRTEISFHEDVKLLGFLCLLIDDIKGDILEIGVWKGKSLACMNKIVGGNRKVIGIDPCELYNQRNELYFYKDRIFPSCILLDGYSEYMVKRLTEISNSIALLHIDGGHEGRNIVLDFLMYSPLLISGGFIVFDDYHDNEYSPDVGPTVDWLRVGGFFNAFKIIGNFNKYRNSYVIQKL
jgi:predicted O-methyltransferase YrrM